MNSVSAHWAGHHARTLDADGRESFTRLDPTHLVPPSTDLLAQRASMAAGVRAGWRTDGGVLTVAGDGSDDCAPYDVLVNGERVARLLAVGRQHHTLDLGELPADSLVELWLPHFGVVQVAAARLDGVRVAPSRGEGPRWLTYGSSITHCEQASGPTETWPALVARTQGWQLTNLGVAGECQLDPAAAHTIATTPAELISLCVGINSYNAATYSERTWAGALEGFLTTVRRAHPTTPLVVITPLLSLPREATPNAVGWTLADYRAASAAVVRARQDRGDTALHLIDGATVLSPQEAQERMPDTLHPDNAGYALMAARLGPLLATALDPAAAGTPAALAPAAGGTSA